VRILLIGASGQLGQDLKTVLAADHEIITPDHDELDVTDAQCVKEQVSATAPEVVINASAFHNVPLCETEPCAAFAVNAAGPLHLARSCRSVHARFFHLSTDYVFNGAKGHPYVERDAPRPLMVYGTSKLAGEHLALLEWEDTLIVRSTGLFGLNPCRAKPGGLNFIDTMLNLARTRGEVKVVDDQACCPTYTPDLARQIAAMIDTDMAPGVYHAVTPPGCSWYDLAKLIFDIADIDTRLTPVSSVAFPSAFRRPPDSRLANSRLERAGIFKMRPIENALMDYLGNKNKHENHVQEMDR